MGPIWERGSVRKLPLAVDSLKVKLSGESESGGFDDTVAFDHAARHRKLLTNPVRPPSTPENQPLLVFAGVMATLSTTTLLDEDEITTQNQSTSECMQLINSLTPTVAMPDVTSDMA